MAKMSADLARSLFDYDPAAGTLRWKIYNGRTKKGSVAGTRMRTGYIRVMYQQQGYMAHCLAWAIAYGEWPPHQVDHRNRARDDNRLENLRPATHADNARNIKLLPSHNSSGVKGVHFRAQRGKWQASVRAAGKMHYFGLHDTIEAAAEARRVGAEKLFGEFANERANQ